MTFLNITSLFSMTVIRTGREINRMLVELLGS